MPEHRTTAPAVTLHQLAAGFGTRSVLRQLTLTAPAGRVLAIIGPSGCGKSTLLRCINRLHELDEDAFVSGDVLVGGASVYADGTNVVAMRRRIGMVFQRLHLLPHLSVRHNVEFALKARGKDSHMASVWLERLHISHLADRSVSNLSGGEAQKVALARALAPEPPVLLLDEPLSAVDAESRADLRSVLAECLQVFGGIAILVSHDSDDVVSLATSVMAL
jgi:iron(III) transport system ATP-binding protein